MRQPAPPGLSPQSPSDPIFQRPPSLTSLKVSFVDFSLESTTAVAVVPVTVTDFTVMSNVSASSSASDTAEVQLFPLERSVSISELASRLRQIWPWSDLRAADSRSSTVPATSFLTPVKSLAESEPALPHPVARPAAASTSARRRDAGTPPAYLLFVGDGPAARPTDGPSRAPRTAARGAADRAAPPPVRGRGRGLREGRLRRGERRGDLARGRHVEGDVLRALRQQGGVHPRAVRRSGDGGDARARQRLARRGEQLRGARARRHPRLPRDPRPVPRHVPDPARRDHRRRAARRGAPRRDPRPPRRRAAA